jgi:hypothetical protein
MEMVAGMQLIKARGGPFFFSYCRGYCIETSAEREKVRECCASGRRLREIHRVFHKIVENMRTKTVVPGWSLVRICCISFGDLSKTTRALGQQNPAIQSP